MRNLPLYLLLGSAMTLATVAEAQTRATRTPAIRRTNTTNANARTGAQAANATPANAATSTTEVAQQLAKAERGKGGRPKLKFDNAPAELFLQIYSQEIGRAHV